MDWVLGGNTISHSLRSFYGESLQQDPDELEALFDLYVAGLDEIAQDEGIHTKEVKVRVVGRTGESLIGSMRQSKTPKRGPVSTPNSLSTALHMGEEEIVDAVRGIAADHASGNLQLLRESTLLRISNRLYDADIQIQIW